MKITKTSQLSGITRTLEIPVTPQQVEAWKSGLLIQDVMPELTKAQREFIMTGITQDEWDQFCDIDEEEL